MYKTSLLALSATLAISACSTMRIDRPLRVASGLTSHLLCSGTFVSGLDPDKVFAEAIEPIPGMRIGNWALRYEVDKERRQVTASFAGLFASRAIYNDGLGCMLAHDDRQIPSNSIITPWQPSASPALPAVAGPAVVAPTDKQLEAAVGQAFSEPERPPYRGTKAVVVLKGGEIVAERYAPGYGIETQLPGFSVTKSVTNALTGILVRQGRISLNTPGSVAQWRDASDPRHAVTVDMLLRQTSGLDYYQTNSGFDPSSRMKYIESDMAGFAQTAQLLDRPGTKWAYTDGNFMLLSRIVRDAVGKDASDVLQFARRELFDPLGMRNVTFEFDATGTPLGAHSMHASARDWARFGMLYLNDGMAGAQRILPEGWVRYSASQTLDTGYGAGFFTNAKEGNVSNWGVPWGMPDAPRDTFFARGYMGQYVVIVPSERLVIARFSVSHVRGDDIETTSRLVGDVVAAIRAKAKQGH